MRDYLQLLIEQSGVSLVGGAKSHLICVCCIFFSQMLFPPHQSPGVPWTGISYGAGGASPNLCPNDEFTTVDGTTLLFTSNPWEFPQGCGGILLPFHHPAALQSGLTKRVIAF